MNFICVGSLWALDEEGKDAGGRANRLMMNSDTRISLTIAVMVFVAMCASHTYAQGPAALITEGPVAVKTAATPTNTEGVTREEMERRIAQLEADMEQMRAEINRLKAAPANGNVASAPGARADAARETAPPAVERAQDKPAQPPRPGFDLAAVHVVPYGTISFNLFGNSGGTNNADVPLFATPTGPGGVNATARETRLGVRLEGPKIVGAKTSGVFETDFTGGFPSIGIGEDFGVLRIRLAYMKFDWQNTTLEAGQDWTIFAPLNPVSLASYGASEFAAAGNLFARIPQLRLQHRWKNGKVTWDGAVLAPRTGDYPAAGTTPAVLQPGAGSASREPSFETRVALNSKNFQGTKKAASVGLSGHYGRARAVSGPRVIDLDVEGVAGDWSVPFGKRVTWAGEAFWGRNLAGYQGDIFQTFIPDFAYRVGATLVPGGPKGPATRGSWTQFGFTPPTLKDRLTFYGSLATDDPRDRDLISISKRDSKVRNRASAFSFIYKFTPQIQWGLEFRRLETDYIFSHRQNNNHLNLSAAYSF